MWLLGEKYQQLGRECGCVVAAGSAGEIAGVMWGLNSSKAWMIAYADVHSTDFIALDCGGPAAPDP